MIIRVANTIVPIKTSYTINRLSYFGLDAGRFIAFEETAKHTIKVPYQAVQWLYQLQLGQTAQKAQAGTGMPGEGMMPNMGAPGPGAMPPDMMGAAGPFGGPAMGMGVGMGMGMPGMEPSGPGAYGPPGMMMQPGGMGYGGAMGGYQVPDVNVEITSTLSIIEQKAEELGGPKASGQ